MVTATAVRPAPPAAATTAAPGRAPLRGRVRLARLLVLGVAMLVLPNLAILGMHLSARRSPPVAGPAVPVKNFAQVDDWLWRGAAPGPDAYEALARQGVVTVVDLRAEDNLSVDEPLLDRLGLTRVHLPMRDGQSPSADQVERFIAAVSASRGRVFVHCGAGVGRTGTMAAAYLVRTGQATPSEAVRRNLAVGPPSLEQLAFSAGLRGATVNRPAPLMVAISRLIDAPRRIWVSRPR